MKKYPACLVLAFICTVTCAFTATSEENKAGSRVVLLTQSKGFVHGVVRRQNGESLVERTFRELAERFLFSDWDLTTLISRLQIFSLHSTPA